jgi:hypothetical protein
MSMHILPVYYTTTKTGGRKKSLSSRQEEANRKHQAWILSMTKGKTSNKKVLAKNWSSYYNENMKVDQSDYVSHGISGNCPKAEPNVYTGGNLVGIATMHKSNMVPIFAENKQAATDIAKMRR